MVFNHFDGYSIPFLLELVRSLRELRGIISAYGFEPGLNGNQCFSSKHKVVQGFPGRLFQSSVVGLEAIGSSSTHLPFVVVNRFFK